MTQVFALGALPSPPDDRDYPVAQFLPPAAAAVKLEPEWSFADLLQAPRNQGGEGTCCGFGLAGTMGYQQNTMAPAGKAPDHEVLSPRDIYEGARRLEPVPGGQQGAYPRAALAYALKEGVCLEADWPYVEGAAGAPGPNAAASRARNKLKTYSRVDLNVEAIKRALYWYGPQFAAAAISTGWYNVDATGRIVRTDAPLGGHAFYIVGWSDSRQAWLIRNSWGAEWGMGGNAWLPYGDPFTEVWSCTPALDEPLPEKPWHERLFPWWRF